MSDKVKFRSKLGLIAATVGSSVGLGNIWRFPAQAQENGGGAFLLLYLLCVFVLGIPVMLSEFSLGRGGNSDTIGVFKRLTPGKKWYLSGYIAVISTMAILSFYMVVAGWTLEYLWASITGTLYDSPHTGEAVFVGKMNEMIYSHVTPVVWTLIMLGLNFWILLKGVNKGIEKISNILMPILFVILIAFCIVSLNLPNASEGVKYFLEPDFSKITTSSLLAALGQAFFSLSLGMGILITYAAYYPDNTNLTRTSVTVSSLGFLVAVLMGLIIFPAVKSFGISDNGASVQGATLVFITLPEIFAQLPATRLWSTLFFLLLATAAITSTISLGEVNIALLQDRFKFSRIKASLCVMLPIVVTSTICSLSLCPDTGLMFNGESVFNMLDNMSTNYLLPIFALLGCIYVGWVLPKSFLSGQLTNQGTLRGRIFPFVLIVIRYIAPALIILILGVAIFK